MPEPWLLRINPGRLRGARLFFLLRVERMRYGKRLAPTPEEIRALIKAIQALRPDDFTVFGLTDEQLRREGQSAIAFHYEQQSQT